jgi:hypothetical protein
MIDRSRELYGPTGASFNGSNMTWRDLPGGRQVEFGGVANPGDAERYRGRPHDGLFFDEADQFPEHVVRFLSAWLRTTMPNQHCQLVLCFNPPATAEGRWLIKFLAPWLDPRHPKPAAPGELRYYATTRDGKEIECPSGAPFTSNGEVICPKSRTFIPGRVQDNPALMATDYLAQLLALPEPLRSQLAYGDMRAGTEDDPWQVIPTVWVEAAQARWTPHPGDTPLTCIGVDVARGGSDQTVLAPRHRTWFGPLQKHPGHSTPDGPAVVGLIFTAIRPNHHALVTVDVIGIGASVFDGCVQRNLRTWGVHFGERIDATDKSGRLTFANVRAFAYWSFREALDPRNNLNVALPLDPELLADLTAPKWSLVGGAIKVESKEEVIKRIGRSPDCGDAVVLASLVPRQDVLGGAGPVAYRA